MDEQPQTYSGIINPENNSVYQRLLMQKRNLENNLERVKRAIELLDKAPETKEIIEAISKITHF